MFRGTLTRAAAAVATVLVLSALVYFGTDALPGDAAEAYLGQAATPQLLAQAREDAGLDRPVLTRYQEWLEGLAHGDLGQSLSQNKPVTEVIGEGFKYTAVLALVTGLLLIVIGVPLGAITAIRSGGVLDHALGSLTLGLIALPEFVVGTILAVAFGVWLSVLPAVSLVDPSRPLHDQWEVLVLPVVVLLANSVAQTIRMVRACVLDCLSSEYVRMARLKGVPERSVLFHHVLGNAMGPTLQILALNIGYLAGGVVIVEAVFNYPGVGSVLASAVAGRDIPTVVAISMILLGVYVVLNFLADLGAMALNPRLRRHA
jgi:peptide/nickel transport system permease protein